MRWAPKGPLRSVVVTTRSGHTLKGVLVDERRSSLVLRAAALADVQPQGVSFTPLDGDVVIPMDNVDFWQEVEPDALD